MATVDIGRVLPRHKGTWNNTTVYTKQDIVVYAGSSYVCKVATVPAGGATPAADASRWGLIAQKGDKGDDGYVGKDGATGAKGATGARGASITAVQIVNRNLLITIED